MFTVTIKTYYAIMLFLISLAEYAIYILKDVAVKETYYSFLE